MNGFLWIISVIIVFWVYLQIWRRFTPENVNYTVEVQTAGLTAGDEFTATLVLENHLWIPVPMVKVSQLLPEGMEAKKRETWTNQITFVTYLLPKQRIRRQYTLRGTARGLYRFDKAVLQIGDGIGFFEILKDVYTYTRVLVRPKVLDSYKLPLPLQQLVGEVSVTRWYQEDTSRFYGIRPYHQGDSFRHIHWAASARTGQLMTKQFETTSETSLHVAVNVQFFDPYWLGGNKLIIESQYALAASLFRYAAESGHPFSFCTNASWAETGYLAIPLGSNYTHYETILTAIAGLSIQAACPYSEVLQEMQQTIHATSTIIIFTPTWNRGLAEAVTDLQAQSHHLILLVPPALTKDLKNIPSKVTVLPLHMEAATSYDSGQEA